MTFSINGIFLTTIHGVWYDTIRDKLTDKDQERSPIVSIQNRSTGVQVTETAAVQLSSEQLAKLSIFRHEDLTPYVRSWKRNEENKLWALFTLQLNKTPDSSILVVAEILRRRALCERCEVFLCADYNPKEYLEKDI